MEASANSADSGPPVTPPSRNGREVVSASLEGLVHAVDGLKTSMGYDDFNTVQSLINDLRQENEELRSYAEAAIREAQKLKQANDTLAEQLAERALEDRMGAAVAETSRLAALADEFDREEAAGRGAEADRLRAEADELRARVAELETDNGGLERAKRDLSRRVSELEQSLAGVGAGAGLAGAAVLAGAVAATPGSAGSAVQSSPLRAGASPRGGPFCEAQALDFSTPRVGGSGSPAASAALQRTTSARVTELTLQNQDLRAEVESLTETMFGKTFRPPSAWAEREIRYKRDERAWAEERRELEGELEGVRSQLSAARAAEDTGAWQAQIRGLEARLVDSERARQEVTTKLHDMELSARAEPGEWGSAGKRLPAATAVAGVGAAVAATNGPVASGGRAAATADLQARLSAALQERDALRNQLAAAHGAGAAPDGAAVGAAVATTALVADGAVAGTGEAAGIAARAAKREAHAAHMARLADLNSQLQGLEAAQAKTVSALLASRTEGNSLESLRENAKEHAGPGDVRALEAEVVRVDLAIREAVENVDAVSGAQRVEALERERDDLLAKLLAAASAQRSEKAGDDDAKNDASNGDHHAAQDDAGAQDDVVDPETKLFSLLTAKAGVLAAIAEAEASGAAGDVAESGVADREHTLGDASTDGVAGTGKAAFVENASPTAVHPAQAQGTASEHPTPGGGVAASPLRTASGDSLGSSAGRALSADRAAADAAWEEYAASSDLPALRRARAELEARCALLEAQIGKMAGELDRADADKAELESAVHAAVSTGDISPLKEKAGSAANGAVVGAVVAGAAAGAVAGAAGTGTTPKPAPGVRTRVALGRMFRGFGGAKSRSTSVDPEIVPAPVAGQQAGPAPAPADGPVPAAAQTLAPSAEVDEELRALRSENAMIMEHLVMTKVRMAEMEGDYLESKRSLLRAREKHLELAKKLSAAQAAVPVFASAGHAMAAGPLGASVVGAASPGPAHSEVVESAASVASSPAVGGGVQGSPLRAAATPETHKQLPPRPESGNRGLRIPGFE